MSLTEAECIYDGMWIQVCEYMLLEGVCICGYHDNLPQLNLERVKGRFMLDAARIVKEMEAAYYFYKRRGIDPHDHTCLLCPDHPATACHDCYGKWWCDPDFWIPLCLGEIDDVGTPIHPHPLCTCDGHVGHFLCPLDVTNPEIVNR